MGQVITFYSYKGGVGRSMALANVAVLLSNWGFKTLMIDWDLEAPGLENFFREYTDVASIAHKDGILEYLTAAQKNGKKLDWQDYVTSIQTPLSREPIHLMPAGKRDADYFKRLREFDISKFYDEHNGGKIIENLRNQLKSEYDFILVDSRTGVTDVGGICTIQMPDMLVLLFTPTEQGLNGIKFIADSARKGQQHLPVARKRLMVFPVPTRIDSNTEFKISQEWTERFARELAPYYEDWLPTGVSPVKFIEHTKLPYVPYFSYGEKLPVIEQGMDDKGGLGYAFENLAALMANGLEDPMQFMDERDNYVRRLWEDNNLGIQSKIAQSSAPSHPLKSPQLVYISKSHSRGSLTNKIVEDLKKLEAEYDVLIWDESSLLPGDEVSPQMKKTLAAADMVLFFLSKNASNAPFFNEEIQVALHSKPTKRIIPVFLDREVVISPNITPLLSYKGILFSGETSQIIRLLTPLFNQKPAQPASV